MSAPTRDIKLPVSARVPSIEDYAWRLEGMRTAATCRLVTTKGVDIGLVPDGELISVVTVTFNSAATVERTIRSVMDQSHEHVEYVIIDGGSTDNTIDIIRRYEGRLSYWHSHPDQGISDAFNLGIAATRGHYIALVNSDDWMSPDQAARAVRALASCDAAFVFGRLAYHEPDGRLIYVMDGDPGYRESVRHRMPGVNHATMVVRRSAYARVGLFDTSRRIAMDYDWLLRAELAGLYGVYEPQLLGHMTEGGVCFTRWADGLREVRDSAIARGQPAWPARWHCAVRLVHGHVRQFLRRTLPKSLVDRVHRWVNPTYRPVSSPAPGER
jgi:glycosyltransferase involved in cell wall biosynthesis